MLLASYTRYQEDARALTVPVLAALVDGGRGKGLAVASPITQQILELTDEIDEAGKR
jgi:hypothetical protein